MNTKQALLILSSRSPSPSPSGASTTSSYPTSPALPVATPLNLDSGLDLATAGALNGTSLHALLPTDRTDWVLLFFQHESTDLKYARKSSDNTWQGGESIEGVPKAINKTPLAGVSYLTEPNARYATVSYSVSSHLAEEHIFISFGL